LQDAWIEGRDGDGAAVAAVENGETQAEGIASGRTNLPITRSTSSIFLCCRPFFGQG